jgi:hypothetical protein
MEYLKAQVNMKVRPTKLAPKLLRKAYTDLGAFTISSIAPPFAQTIYCKLPNRDEEYAFRPNEITDVDVVQ